MKNLDICFCGSGLVYTNCCKNKINPFSNDKLKRMHMSDLLKTRNTPKELCIHPQHEETTLKATGAHNISRKSVLEQISHNYKVLMPIVDGFTGKVILKLRGTATQATVFPGFCNTHDKMFADIDDINFTINPKTLFLFGYRAFALSYFKVSNEYRCYCKMISKYNYITKPEIILFYKNVQLGLEKLNNIKATFDNAIVNSQYDVIKSEVIKLNYKVNFATSSTFVPIYDLMGNNIDYYVHKLPLIYVSVMPSNGCTYIVFSCLKGNSKIYKHFFKQLHLLPKKFLMKCISNMLLLNCENIVMSPLLWESWSKEGQEEFMQLQNDHYENFDYIINREVYYKTRSFNLFEKILI